MLEKGIIAGISILAGFGMAKMSVDRGEFSGIGASFPWMAHGGVEESATWNELF